MKRTDNPTEKNLADREYYRTHKEQCLRSARAYRAKNLARVRAKDKRYYDKRKLQDPGFFKEHSRKSYYNNRDKKLIRERRNYLAKRVAFLGAVGGCKCRACGFSDWRALQIDHVNGDGAEQRREAGFATFAKFRHFVLNNLDKFQILCANCNWIKKYENQEKRKKGPSPYPEKSQKSSG